MAKGDVAAFAFGSETPVEGTDGRVVLNGGARGVPEVKANQSLPLGDMISVPGGKGLPCLSTPELLSSGKTPK